jgi:hypothetical protein
MNVREQLSALIADIYDAALLSLPNEPTLSRKLRASPAGTQLAFFRKIP